MTEFAYYPGCSLRSSAVEYDLSVKAVFGALGYKLHELDGWICCGASPAHQVDAKLSSNLAAFNIMLAAKDGLDIVVPCAACFNRLKTGLEKLTKDDIWRRQVEKDMGFEFKPVKVLSPLEVIAKDENIEKLQSAIKKTPALSVVPYYGCLLVRPPKVMQFDDPEDPVLMNQVLEAAGIAVLPWEYKTECCGGSLSFGNLDSTMRLTRRILNAAKKAGAQGIAVACPLCHQNMDARQPQVNKQFRESFNIPIYYFTELIGAAMGIDPKDFGADKHIIDALKALKV